MRTYHDVDQVFFERHEMMIPIDDGRVFKPAGRFQWLQRMAWRFLDRAGVLDQAYRPVEEVKRVQFNSQDFMTRLFKLKGVVEDFDREPTELIIGSQDFQELMVQKEINQPWGFSTEYMHGKTMAGLNVRVIPWMRGFVVLP